VTGVRRKSPGLSTGGIKKRSATGKTFVKSAREHDAPPGGTGPRPLIGEKKAKDVSSPRKVGTQLFRTGGVRFLTSPPRRKEKGPRYVKLTPGKHSRGSASRKKTSHGLG